MCEPLEITEKKCSKCGEVKPVGEFRIDNAQKSGFTCRCKQCLCKKDKIYRANNKEKITEYQKKLRVHNREKIIEYESKYRLINKDKISIRNKNCFKKRRNTLSVSYLKQLITNKSNLKFEDIPQELIEAKRAEIQFNRLIKNYNHDQN